MYSYYKKSLNIFININDYHKKLLKGYLSSYCKVSFHYFEHIMEVKHYMLKIWHGTIFEKKIVLVSIIRSKDHFYALHNNFRIVDICRNKLIKFSEN